jgi:hypothetical protein
MRKSGLVPSCLRCLAVLGALACAGCAERPAVAPGLANVASIPDLRITPDIGVHDAIANGHDSCPRARVEATDPLRFRYPACPGKEVTPSVLSLTALGAAESEPIEGDDLWNVHLRGLPPCEGSRGDELAIAVCR